MYAISDKYPIDTEEQLKTAAEYFDKYLSRFPPSSRAIIANNMCKQASALGVDLDRPWVLNYSRWSNPESGYSPDFNKNMDMRKEACSTYNIKVKVKDNEVDAAQLIEKLASSKDQVAPTMMMAALEHFDKLANLESHYDTRIMDPIFTVFGSLSNPQYDSHVVAEGMTNYQLKKVAHNKEAMEKVSSAFGVEFVAKFKKDPVQTFSSMREPERAMVSQLLCR
jgi:hypothetical protein